MTVEASVLVTLGHLLELLDAHPARKCETLTCDAAPVLPRLGVLDRDRSQQADAAVYDCQCGWIRTEPLKLNKAIR